MRKRLIPPGGTGGCWTAAGTSGPGSSRKLAIIGHSFGGLLAQILAGRGLSFEQFRYGFGNAVSEEEAKQLYERYSVAGSGVPILQAAFANFNPRTEAKADKKNPNRGHSLTIDSGWQEVAQTCLDFIRRFV